jgi:hypothetical protein
MEFKDFFTVTSQSLFAIGSAFIADRRGGLPLVWFILGLIFGPLAFVVALTAGKKCKHCFSWIPKEAIVCRDCTKEQ